MIKKISTDNLRPLKINGIQVQHRYSILKSLFKKNNAYYIFAEPDFTFIHSKQIIWNTELKNEAVSYINLNQEEKQRINSILKNQLKHLYNRALYIYENDTENKNIFESLDKAIEIPNLSDIHIIQENNKAIIVLIRWGAISDEYNATKGIIKKLVPIKIKDITFNIKYKNGNIATDQELFFKFNNQITRYTTDNNGKINYCDIPFWQKIEVWCNDENQTKIYNQTFECNSIDSYDIILPSRIQYYDMKVIVLDLNSIPVKQKDFIITQNNIPQNYVTDSQGSVVLPNIEEKQNISCKIIDVNEDEKKFNFVNEGKNYYIIKINTEKNIKEPIKESVEPQKKHTEPVAETVLNVEMPISIPISSTSKKILNVINRKNKIVSGAKVFINNTTEFKKTDKQGKLFFESEDDTLINLLIKKANVKVKSELFITNATEYTVKIPAKKRIWLYLLILLALIALTYYFIFWSNKKDNYIHKVFISGHLVSDECRNKAFSIAFKNDRYSVTIEKEGIYNLKDFPKVIDYTLDGFAIGNNTRMIFYASDNCNGKILLDTIGPIIINCKKWKNNGIYNTANSKKYKENLQKIFPQEKRIWSKDTLENFHNGSIKIIFE